MFENWQGINPMGLSAPWVDYKNKQLFIKIKMKQSTLWCNKKIQGIKPMGISAPLWWLQKQTIIHKHVWQKILLCNTEKFQGIKPMGIFRSSMTIKNQFCTNMKTKKSNLRCNTKHLQESTQWALVPLCQTHTYTTSNLKNLSNCLEYNKCIDGDRWNHKKLAP